METKTILNALNFQENLKIIQFTLQKLESLKIRFK